MLPFLFALLLTCVSEGLVCLLFPIGAVPRKRVLLAGLAGNLLTNPLLNLTLLLSAGSEAYAAVLCLLEIAAVVTEAILYRKAGGLSAFRSAALSFSANLLSFAFGLLCF